MIYVADVRIARSQWIAVKPHKVVSYHRPAFEFPRPKVNALHFVELDARCLNSLINDDGRPVATLTNVEGE